MVTPRDGIAYPSPMQLRARPAGLGIALALPGLDFETYSEAGYVWTGAKWAGAKKNTSGIAAVGAWAYSRHPSCEVLSCAYDLLDGHGERVWTPGLPAPHDLMNHIFGRGLLGAFNSFFEYCIWLNVCAPKLGWPELPIDQLRDTQAKCCTFGLPKKLEHAADFLGGFPKDTDGTKIMKRVSRPRTPTKIDKRMRYTPENDGPSFARLYEYNANDVTTESGVAMLTPELSPFELAVWKLDQRINARGVFIDLPTTLACNQIIDQAEARYNTEIFQLTGGQVRTADSHVQLKVWLGAFGLPNDSTDKAAVEALLGGELPDVVRQVLERRAKLAHAAVKKMRSMALQADADDHRLRGLFTYAGAVRTWRWAGNDPQPHNLVAVWPEHATALQALGAVRTGSLSFVELAWGDGLRTLAGVLRALFMAAPGHDLVCADFNSIEAGALAMLAGEQWRIDVFRTHGQIYEAFAAQLGGISLDDVLRHKCETGTHHPLRKRGKVGELASQYGGWVGAWLNMGAGEFMTEAEIETGVKKWRRQNPAIVKYWGDCENAARSAIDLPGHWFPVRTVAFAVFDDVLYCMLPSGRAIPYHCPRIVPGERYDKPVREIWFQGAVGDRGRMGWIKTYGASIVENITQACCRDILAAAMLRVDAAGYPIVLHIHDEIAAEVPEGWGSVEELEALMVVREPWFADWPIKATGGWRGKRFRKD